MVGDVVWMDETPTAPDCFGKHVIQTMDLDHQTFSFS